jgi:hypothetical protein
MIVQRQEHEPITRPDAGEHPPCFGSVDEYEAWLAAASKETGHPPPARRQWPGEPNYCRDCTSLFRNLMRQDGRCLFPRTRFEIFGEGEDEEVVGVE